MASRLTFGSTISWQGAPPAPQLWRETGSPVPVLTELGSPLPGSGRGVGGEPRLGQAEHHLIGRHAQRQPKIAPVGADAGDHRKRAALDAAEQDRPAVHLGCQTRGLQVGVYFAVNGDQIAGRVCGGEKLVQIHVSLVLTVLTITFDRARCPQRIGHLARRSPRSPARSCCRRGRRRRAWRRARLRQRAAATSASSSGHETPISWSRAWFSSMSGPSRSGSPAAMADARPRPPPRSGRTATRSAPAPAPTPAARRPPRSWSGCGCRCRR